MTTLVLGCAFLAQLPPTPPTVPLAETEQALPLPEPGVLQPADQPELTPTPATEFPPEQPPTELRPIPQPELSSGADQPEAQPAEPMRHHLTPPEMVAEALDSPPGSTLTGRPLTLLSALSTATDHRQMGDVAAAYWQLAEAIGLYNVALHYKTQLGQVEPASSDPTALRTALASATAMVREAELSAVAAQHDLAVLMRLPTDGALPLPADRPHAGPYATHFDQVSAVRTPAPRARLLDRALPIRFRAIDARAGAVSAAEEALSAASAAYGSGHTDLATVLICHRQLFRQRWALITSVGQYNREIADYAVAVVAPGTSAQALVAMLIQPNGQPVRPLVSGEFSPGMGTGTGSSGVQPATLNEELSPTPAGRPELNVPTRAIRPGENVPTPAVRPEKNVPTPAVRPEGLTPTPAVRPERAEDPLIRRLPPTGTGWQSSESAGEIQPGTLPADIESSPQEQEEEPPAASTPVRPMVPVEAESSSPASVTVNRPVVGDVTQAAAAMATPGLYSGLVDATPAVRAKELTQMLCWDRLLPDGIGEPLSLLDALTGVPTGSRRDVIEAYWALRQRLAEYQVIAEQAQMLDAISAVAADSMPEPSRSRLRAAELTTTAALGESHVLLVEAQFELAQRTGRTIQLSWPVASTVPHCGRYLLKLDSQPKSLVESWPMRRLTAMIPRLAESVPEHATALVEADAARAAATTQYRPDQDSIEPVLEAISRQTDLAFALLETLTEYNHTIAGYALAVLPPETPHETLVSSLVVAR